MIPTNQHSWPCECTTQDELVQHIVESLRQKEQGDENEDLDRCITHKFQLLATQIQEGKIEMSRLLDKLELEPAKRQTIETIFKHAIQQNSSPKTRQNWWAKAGNMIYGVISGIVFLPSNVFHFCVVSFKDGNHSWKLLKYVYGLKGIIDGAQIPLDEVKKDLANIEEPGILETLTLNTIKTLFQENVGQTVRETYRQYLDNLRLGLDYVKSNKIGDDNLCATTLKEMCYNRFTNIHIYTFCEKLVCKVIEEGYQKLIEANPDLSKKHPFTESLELLPLDIQIQCIQLAPQCLKAPLVNLFFERLSGALNVLSDPQRRTNMPYVLFEINVVGKPVKVIRTGTPTTQRNDYSSTTYEGEASITPEFYHFIDYLRTHKQKLLFVSLQDDVERLAGSEKARNTALKLLAEEFPNTFELIILSKDSDWYYQRGPFSDIFSAAIFKKTFLQQLTQPSAGFHLPQKFQKGLPLILDQLHSDLLGNTEILTHQDRLDFIEMAYHAITVKCLKESSSDFLINCCKDSIDRAGISNAILHYIQLIMTNNTNCKEHIKQLHTYIHAATLLVKKRGMNERKLRLIPLLQRLQYDHVCHRLQIRLGDTLSGLTIKQTPSQTIE